MPFLTTLKSKLPKKRWQRALLYAASTFFIVLAADMSLTAYWRRISISKETSYITAPLFPDGMPDYISWLDQRAAQGVTPENNAAIPLLRATGLDLPSDEYRDWLKQVMFTLAIPGDTLPAENIIRYSDWVLAHGGSGTQSNPATQPSRNLSAISEQQDHMLKKPWSDADFPDGARWLDSQQEAFTLAHEAATRSRFYIPLIPSNPQHRSGEAAQVILPYLGNFRALGRMLNADALRHAHDGDKSIFIRDVTDTLKLGSLLSHQDIVITRLVGLAMMREGYETIAAALDLLTPADARALLAAIDKVPAPGDLDLTGERCMFLDLCCFEASVGLGHSIWGRRDQPKAAPVISLIVPVHYNNVMTEINSIFDRLDDARHIPSLQKREEIFAATEKELYTGANTFVFAASGMINYQPAGTSFFSGIFKATQESLTRRDLARLALALTIYRADKGNYPPTLDPLAGPNGILKEIPVDAFSDQPLIYRPAPTGYTLYSVGNDYHDDHADPAKDLVIKIEH